MVEQKDILLVTLNSSYAHTAFGLRYLFANLKNLQTRSEILESTIAQKAQVILEQILLRSPKIVGFGIYIWNTNQTLEVIKLLKEKAPEIIVVLGGPEVSHESETQEICKISDFVIKGEADFLFYEFCEKYFAASELPNTKFISGSLPEIKNILKPYHLYSDTDIQNRVLYVEASRGCPYRCEYCLSSLDKSVRSFDLDSFLSDIKLLIERGARQFKFVDRTFNLSITTGTRILEFFYEHIHLGLFLHFEMVPDRLPNELKVLIQKFPPGSLQFEIGIQTLNPEVAKNVSRKNDLVKVKENFKFLTQETGVHIHADLIVGLPGENLESFAKGFDELYTFGSHEIQVGILKRLKGTPIIRHDQNFQMKYSSAPPYQIQSNKDMPSHVISQMASFSKFWDLFANSGRFKNFMAQLIAKSEKRNSLFWEFFEFSQFLFQHFGQSHSLSLLQLTEAANTYLKQKFELSSEEAGDIMLADYCFGDTPRDIPAFLKRPGLVSPLKKSKPLSNIPERQQRHLPQ